MGHDMGCLTTPLLYSFSEAGRAANALLRASTKGELQQLVMHYDACQHCLCEHSIRRSLGACQQGIKSGGTSQGCCRFHEVMQASKEKLQVWLEEEPVIPVECRIVCGDIEVTTAVDLRPKLSVEGAKRVLVREAALQWEKNCVTEEARSLRVQLAARVMAPEDVVVRMGDCTLDDNVETLDAVGVECGALLDVVIAREAIEQKLADIYAATKVAPIEQREAAEKEKIGNGSRGREQSIGLTGKYLRQTFRPHLNMCVTLKRKRRGGRRRGRQGGKQQLNRRGGGNHKGGMRKGGGRSNGKRSKGGRRRKKDRQESPISITVRIWQPKNVINCRASISRQRRTACPARRLALIALLVEAPQMVYRQSSSAGMRLSVVLAVKSARKLQHEDAHCAFTHFRS